MQAPDALAAMTAHDWPGNALERPLAYAADAALLTAADLRFD